jgi:hypothetical protein
MAESLKALARLYEELAEAGIPDRRVTNALSLCRVARWRLCAWRAGNDIGQANVQPRVSQKSERSQEKASLG